MPKRKHDSFSSGSDWGKTELKKNVKDKNSLDSDEEDEDLEESKYKLQDEDIEGQEEGGAILEEGVQFTPFNMKEEMEEGHFDKEGMYHWKKDKEIRDSWLDDIDWVKIKSKEEPEKKKSEEESDDEMPEAVDSIAIYKKILSYMNPKETIAKTLRRIGGNKSLSASERLKLKKAGLLPITTDKDGKDDVAKLTELANKILTHSGNMDIYQESYEHIRDLIDASTSKSNKEPELDMYSDDFGVKEQERLDSSVPETKSPTTTGLDPAKPWFSGNPPDQRLDRSDATFVDCIHTCGGYLGLIEPICHADFYPNGGVDTQPGCSVLTLGVCSHGRSYEYFAESISPSHKFFTAKCDAVPDKSPQNCQDYNDNDLMGYFASPQTHGIFYLETRDAYPFSMNVTS